MATRAVTVDAKGRLQIPTKLRQQGDVKPGDTLIFGYDEERHIFYAAKPETLIERRLAEGLADYYAGETRTLEEIAAEMGVSLDDDA